MLDPNYSDLLSAFLAHDVRFLVVGAYALGVHGRPRATMDFDVWVEATPQNATRVVAALRGFGAPLHGVTEQDFSVPGVGLHIGVPPIRIDVLTEISGVDFDQARKGPGRRRGTRENPRGEIPEVNSSPSECVFPGSQAICAGLGNRGERPAKIGAEPTNRAIRDSRPSKSLVAPRG